MTQELRRLAEAVRDAKTYNELVLAQTKLDDSLTSRQLLELLDRLEKAEKDAERYRWLRSPDTDVSLVMDKRTGWVPPDERVEGVGGYHTYEYRAGEELDAAIDAAMEASK